MRRLATSILVNSAVAGSIAIGTVALAGCIGDIGDNGSRHGASVTGPGPDADGFTCDPTTAELGATPIKRLAKLYVGHAVRELFSTLDEATRDALVAEVQSRLDLIPADAADHYSPNDGNVSQDHVDALFGLAVSLASKIADDPTYSTPLLAVCGAGADKSSLADDACLTMFLTHYGRKAFRRPMQEAEVDDFKAFYQQAVAAGVDGLGMLVGRFVAHPNFYYRFDSEGDLTEGTEGVDAVYALTKWELLSKVTFLFWAAPPTDELYDLVEATDITEDDALASLVEKVLADPRAEQGIMPFYREWLELDKTKMPATEGNVVAGQAMVAAAGIDALPASHRDDMIQEVLDLAKHYTFATEGNLADVLTSRYSFAKTPALAAIYGVEPWDGSADNLVELPAGQRSGLLTRAAFVASNTEYTRPVIKGKLVRTRILCTDISPPPPGLNIKPLTHPADKTTRQALDEATADSLCQSCHSQMNALGYLSESYDPIGRFRTKELRFADMSPDIVSELAIDTKAAPKIDADDASTVADAVELGQLIADSGDADACLVKNYFEFVTGREPDPTGDGCDLQALRDTLTAEGGSIKAMLRATVMQEAFRRRKVQ